MGYTINRKIAIVSYSSDTFSETFIKAQVDLLPASILLHSGWLPTMIGNKLIISKYKKYINYVFKPFFKHDLFSLEREIIKIIKIKKIGAILAQYGPGGCAMMCIAGKSGVPLFVHFHGFDVSDEKILKSYSETYKKLFREANGIIAVSKMMVNKLIELGCPRNKILLNTYGPNDNFFNLCPTYSNQTFFGIGRFVDKKAPHLTILAFKEVIRKYPDAKLIMGGEGELLNACRNIVKAYGIEKNISFPGILKPEEAMKFMENSLAFVQHSIIADSGDSEGTPVAILEASAASLPVIATRHAGIPDVIIHNETGILIEEFDISGMSSAMIRLIENSDMARKMGLAGRERIRNYYTMDRYILALRNFINNEYQISNYCTDQGIR